MKVVVAITAALFSLPAAAQSDRFDKVEIKTTRLGANLYLLEGEGGNIGVSAGDDGVFIIDDQFAPLTARILAAIKAVSDKPVRYLINTHWHFDHTGGNENLGKAGAVIFAHENVRRRMSTGQLIEALNRTEPASPHGALPVVTFTDTVTFHLNGDSIVVFHVAPAHTDGDAIVYFT